MKQKEQKYREAKKGIQKAVKKALVDWMGTQCEKIKTCMNKNNSKRTYQLLKDLISEKQGSSSTIQDRSGKCLIEDQEIHSRWIEYCSELYTTMRVVTMQSCTAVNAQKKIYNQSFVFLGKLRLK